MLTGVLKTTLEFLSHLILETSQRHLWGMRSHPGWLEGCQFRDREGSFSGNFRVLELSAHHNTLHIFCSVFIPMWNHNKLQKKSASIPRNFMCNADEYLLKVTKFPKFPMFQSLWLTAYWFQVLCSYWLQHWRGDFPDPSLCVNEQAHGPRGGENSLSRPRAPVSGRKRKHLMPNPSQILLKSFKWKGTEPFRTGPNWYQDLSHCTWQKGRGRGFWPLPGIHSAAATLRS